VKFDGYRMQVHKAGKRVILCTRGMGLPAESPALTTSKSRIMFSGSVTRCRKRTGRQPLDRAVGDEGEIARNGAQHAHVLGDEGEQDQR
jgi:hypothetical protein